MVDVAGQDGVRFLCWCAGVAWSCRHRSPARCVIVGPWPSECEAGGDDSVVKPAACSLPTDPAQTTDARQKAIWSSTWGVGGVAWDGQGKTKTLKAHLV